MAGGSRHHHHVLDRGAHVLGGHIRAPKGIHGPAERLEEFLRLVGSGIADDHSLSATERETGGGRLVGHGAGEAQHIGERFVHGGVVPVPGSAEGRAEEAGVHPDHRPQPGLRIRGEPQALVPPIRQFLEELHHDRPSRVP